MVRNLCTDKLRQQRGGGVREEEEGEEKKEGVQGRGDSLPTPAAAPPEFPLKKG